MDVDEEKTYSELLDEESSDYEKAICSNPYCYINGTYTDRKALKDNPDFLKNEYQSIKANINHIRSTQITLMTASISAAAIIWGLSYKFTTGNSDILPPIFFLLPLFFLIPSLIIFFDKSISYSKLIGYIRLTELIELGYININYYRGYENYNKCLNCSFINSCHLDLFKGFKKSNENEEKKSKKEKSNSSSKIKQLCLDLINYFSKCYNPMIESREHRFLTIGFTSYLLTAIIGYFFAIYTGYINDLFIINMTVIAFIIPLYVAYIFRTRRCIYGIYNKFSEEYWKDQYDKQQKYFYLIFVYFAIYIIYTLYLKHIDAYNGPLDPAFITILLSEGIAIFALFFVAVAIILIISIPIIAIYKIKNSIKKDDQTKSEVNPKISNFEQYMGKSKKGHFSKRTSVMYIVISFYLFFTGTLFICNLFMSIIWGITLILTAVFMSCLSIFGSVIDGRDNPNEYEKNWFHAIETIDKYYTKFDELDEWKSDIEYKNTMFTNYLKDKKRSSTTSKIFNTYLMALNENNINKNLKENLMIKKKD